MKIKKYTLTCNKRFSLIVLSARPFVLG